MSKPIAMRMNAEQFESIRCVLEANEYNCNNYNKRYDYTYLKGDKDIHHFKEGYGYEDDYSIHEEFNAKIFLNSLGIEYNEPQPTEQVERYNIFDKAQQLIKDAKQQGVEIEIKEGVIILKQVVK